MEISRFALTLFCPMYSRRNLGRSESSVWMSSSTGCASRMRSIGLRASLPRAQRGVSGTTAPISRRARDKVRGGQRHRNHRARPRPRVHVDPPAVLLHDAVRDGHAEAGAAGEVRAERLEEAALV